MAAEVVPLFVLRSPAVAPHAEDLPAGRLVEISAARGSGRTSLAVSFAVRAQRRGEPVAWIQPERGSLHPPDLADAGIDLDALIVVHVPCAHGPDGLVRAAEMLLRSGAFGLVVVDFIEGMPSGAPAVWQSRLQGLVRTHEARLCALTASETSAASAGPLIGVRVEPRREAEGESFLIHPCILRDKAGLGTLASERWDAPRGFAPSPA